MRLTERQWQVLILRIGGACTKEIASILGIDRHTVEYHWDKVRKLIGVEDVAGATLWALAHGKIRTETKHEGRSKTNNSRH